jgi:hypothetical protein
MEQFQQHFGISLEIPRIVPPVFGDNRAQSPEPPEIRLAEQERSEEK